MVLLRRQERRYKPGGLCRERTLYTNKCLRHSMVSQQEEDGYPAKARFNEAGRNSQGFFLHTQALVSTLQQRHYLCQEKNLKEKLTGGGKKMKGKGNFFHQWTCWVGDLAKDSQNFLQRLLYSLERSKERDSEFLSAIDISPFPILQRLSHSPIQNKTKKHNRLWLYMDFIPRSSTFILFSIQGPPTKLCSQQHQVLVICQIPSSTP